MPKTVASPRPVPLPGAFVVKKGSKMRACEAAHGLHLLRMEKLRLERPPVAHVGLHADEVGDPAVCVDHRREREEIPERRAVLAHVEELDAARAARAHGLAELRDRRGIRV